MHAKGFQPTFRSPEPVASMCLFHAAGLIGRRYHLRGAYDLGCIARDPTAEVASCRYTLQQNPVINRIKRGL